VQLSHLKAAFAIDKLETAKALILSGSAIIGLMIIGKELESTIKAHSFDELAEGIVPLTHNQYRSDISKREVFSLPSGTSKRL